MSIICIQQAFMVKMTEQVIDQTCQSVKGKTKDLWISAEEAMGMLRVTSPTTLLAYKDKGEIEASAVSPKHILYNSKSILDFIERKNLNRF